MKVKVGYGFKYPLFAKSKQINSKKWPGGELERFYYIGEKWSNRVLAKY